MGITIYELMQLFIDEDEQMINIWDCDKEEVVYAGEYGDMPNEYEDCEVSSIDNIQKQENVLTINI